MALFMVLDKYVFGILWHDDETTPPTLSYFLWQQQQQQQHLPQPQKKPEQI